MLARPEGRQELSEVPREGALLSAPDLKVGDTAVHVERYGGSGVRRKNEVTIIRETATQWIDRRGTRWRKSDGAMVPQYSAGPRFLMTVEAFKASQVVKS